jgi:hypothetical protein
MTTSDIQSSVGMSFARIAEVERVYIVRAGDTLRVFTIVDDVNEDAYDRIYEHERSLIREFKGTHFDFNVISRRGRDADEIVGPILPAWQRNESAG